MSVASAASWRKIARTSAKIRVKIIGLLNWLSNSINAVDLCLCLSLLAPSRSGFVSHLDCLILGFRVCLLKHRLCEQYRFQLHRNNKIESTVNTQPFSFSTRPPTVNSQQSTILEECNRNWYKLPNVDCGFIILYLRQQRTGFWVKLPLSTVLPRSKVKGFDSELSRILI